MESLTTLAGVLVVNLVYAIFPLIHFPLNVVPLVLTIYPLPCYKPIFHNPRYFYPFGQYNIPYPSLKSFK